MIEAVQNAATDAQSTTAARNNAVVDYDAFLTLMVAQLKNQDPTEPMKANEYMAQLASFSNVEQSVQIRQTLDTLLQSSYLEQASGIVGKTLTSPDGSISGVVTEVQVFSDGMVATLDSGEEVLVTGGVRISE